MIENSTENVRAITGEFSIYDIRGTLPEPVVSGEVDGDVDVDFGLLYKESGHRVLPRT